ncbi:hypothetical protein ALO76_100146 [Pseudomonas syringae pv. coriandricola]|nr:hypothetical protein ALO76_100146 [Pseudomonas syringae pv. coriandricola]
MRPCAIGGGCPQPVLLPESEKSPITGTDAMMHADLIDQEDLLGQLRALGFETPGGATAEQACAQAVCGLNAERATALRRMVEHLLTGSATLLPAVRQAIDQQLLPALAAYRQSQNGA